MDAEILIEEDDSFRFLSELYANDVPAAWLLPEYPSSNSDQTIFRNPSRFIIHDPFPPPRPELLSLLGPHHLMFGWGDRLKVTSRVAPADSLLQHWADLLGDSAAPIWQPWENTSGEKLITLFPHESIPDEQQVINPEVNYHLHSKQVIEEIDCPQAGVLKEIRYPCIVKLSHGYAGLGNFILRNDDDHSAMRSQLDRHWPESTCVINSMIEDVRGDFGVQFYLRANGSVVWLGFTTQHFDENNRWCGGSFTADEQTSRLDDFRECILATAAHLHRHGYFGVVGIDLLQDPVNRHFLVDVNPRLTGISPFLIASRIFAQESGLAFGIYRASCRVPGTLDELLQHVSKMSDAKVAVLSAFEDTQRNEVVCHLSASSNSQQQNIQVLDALTAPAGS